MHCQNNETCSNLVGRYEESVMRSHEPDEVLYFCMFYFYLNNLFESVHEYLLMYN